MIAALRGLTAERSWFPVVEMSTRVLLFLIFTSVAVLFALWKGRWEERTIALTMVFGIVATRIAIRMSDGSYQTVQWPVLAIDLTMLAVFLWVTVKSDRFWPMWASGFMLLGTSSHFFKMMSPEMAPRVYAAAERSPSYFIALALLIGTWRAWQMSKAQAASEQTVA